MQEKNIPPGDRNIDGANLIGAKRSIDSVLRDGIQKRGLPFVIGAVGTKEGTVYEGSCRHADLCAPVDADTMIWIASMTKAVTAVALMQLVEQGELSLQQEAGKILPKLSGVKILEGYDRYGKEIITSCGKSITVEQLLNHTSGLAYSFWNARIDRYYREHHLPDTTSGSLKSLPAILARTPGTGWEYGTSADWAGLILEKLTGMKLGEYFHKFIFTPLKMKSTAFEIQNLKPPAPFFQLEPTGSVNKISFLFPQNAEYHSGGAGLYSTVRDYLRFSRMLLNCGSLDGTKILKPDTVRTMFENRIGRLEVKPLKGCGGSLDLRFEEGITWKWGLCFMINEEGLPGRRSPGSQFWGGAANTFVWIDPKKEITGIFATQVLPFLNEPCERAFSEFEAAVYNCALSGHYN